jgi:hypothetical protein
MRFCCAVRARQFDCPVPTAVSAVAVVSALDPPPPPVLEKVMFPPPETIVMLLPATSVTSPAVAEPPEAFPRTCPFAIVGNCENGIVPCSPVSFHVTPSEEGQTKLFGENVKLVDDTPAMPYIAAGALIVNPNPDLSAIQKPLPLLPTTFVLVVAAGSVNVRVAVPLALSV